MGLRGVGTFQFDIIGDGTSTEMLIPVTALKAPDPMHDQFTASDVFSAKCTGPATVIATMESDESSVQYVRLRFSQPPSASQTSTVTLQMKFGTDRI